MVETRKMPKFFKPTTQTKFRIDFDWWKENDTNWRIFLRSFLCAQHQDFFSNKQLEIKLDVVDPETAEIKQMDGLLYELMEHCAKQEDFIQENIPLVAKVFRLLLANGNQPLTPGEIEILVGKPAQTILTILTGPQVFKGIRMVREK
jgi:hypothetical protein